MEQLRREYDYLKIHQVPQDKQIRYVTLGDKTNKIKAIITCGAHARELLSSQICINFLKEITKKWDQYCDLYLVVVPVVNKNRQRVLKGQICVRANQNGVDPNRNYPTNFLNGVDDKNSITYRGPYPLSEKFSQFMDQLLASQQKWNMLLDIHTGQLALFYCEVKNQTLNKQTVQILKKIKRKHCPYCVVDTIERLEGTISGQMFKYAATKYQVEHSLCFEIYGGSMKSKYPTPVGDVDIDNDLCMKMFNPNTAKSRDFFTDRWVKAVQNTIDQVLQLKRNK